MYMMRSGINACLKQWWVKIQYLLTLPLLERLLAQRAHYLKVPMCNMSGAKGCCLSSGTHTVCKVLHKWAKLKKAVSCVISPCCRGKTYNMDLQCINKCTTKCFMNIKKNYICKKKFKTTVLFLQLSSLLRSNPQNSNLMASFEELSKFMCP